MIRRILSLIADWLTAEAQAEHEASLRHAREQAELEAARRIAREQAKQSANAMIPDEEDLT